MNYYQFKKSIRTEYRHYLSQECLDFLNGLASNFPQKEEVVECNTEFFRAQKGCDWCPVHQYDEDNFKVHIDDIPDPYNEQRMRPRPELAVEGRVNPKGISYLYLATDRATAVSEVRPWIGQEVTIAEFATNCSLRLVDVTAEIITELENLQLHLNHNFVDNKFVAQLHSPEEKLKLAWYEINKAYSMPIEQTDDVADYAPTQIITEFIKSKGYDGIRFKSSVGEGDNIVLFSQKSVAFKKASVFRVTNISLQIEKIETS